MLKKQENLHMTHVVLHATLMEIAKAEQFNWKYEFCTEDKGEKGRAKLASNEAKDRNYVDISSWKTCLDIMWFRMGTEYEKKQKGGSLVDEEHRKVQQSPERVGLMVRVVQPSN